MNPTPSETADLLERAADLYESERIEWCSGGWAKSTFNGSKGQFHCAEGALLRAAGCTWGQLLVAGVGVVNVEDPNKIYSMMRRPEIQQAVRAIKGHFVADDGSAWLWRLNDRLTEKSAKQHLIEAFKDAAKELRNGS